MSDVRASRVARVRPPFERGALERFRRRRSIALPPVGDAAAVERASAIIASADSASGDAFLAMAGDKRFVWSDSARSVLMFGATGRAWIAVGGPVGDPAEFDELAERFIATARRARAWPAFYAVDQATAERLSLFGLTRHKVGERAVIDLARFTLSGKARRGLRNERNRAVRAGCGFELRPPGPLGDLEAPLRRVSDAWLARHGGAEKTFSLGRFDPDYLARFGLAIVRREGAIVAFANIWIHHRLATMDLMRHADDGPGGGMDYLFTEIALWAQASGYAQLDLGLAPLAGLRDEPRPSAVARLGAFVYARGGRFYGFEGLRAFKDKYDPDWEPAYIVAGNQIRAGAAAVAVAALTGGGLRGVLRRTRAGVGDLTP